MLRGYSRRLGPVWKLVDDDNKVLAVLQQESGGMRLTKVEARAGLEVVADWIEENKWKNGGDISPYPV